MKLISESGTFICSRNLLGTDVTLEEFIPTPENIVEKQNSVFKVKSLIIPNGVNHFSDECLRYISVIDTFELPETIKSIGRINWHHPTGNVLANSELPEVMIPQSVEIIGVFAFGNSRIKKLKLPRGIKSEYARQFKGAHIGTLCVAHEEWELPDNNAYIRNFFVHVDYDQLELY